MTARARGERSQFDCSLLLSEATRNHFPHPRAPRADRKQPASRRWRHSDGRKQHAELRGSRPAWSSYRCRRACRRFARVALEGVTSSSSPLGGLVFAAVVNQPLTETSPIPGCPTAVDSPMRRFSYLLCETPRPAGQYVPHQRRPTVRAGLALDRSRRTLGLREIMVRRLDRPPALRARRRLDRHSSIVSPATCQGRLKMHPFAPVENAPPCLLIWVSEPA